MNKKKNKVFKCPFCTFKYVNKPSLYSHMQDKHKDQLNGKSPAQVYFNMKNHKEHGSCIMCGKNTDWNEATERYERLCSEKCKNDYREMFKKRMMKKYGKTTLLNDVEQQNKMLEHRKISGVYTWSDGTKKKYVGSYEKEFLEFCDIFMKMNSNDVISPAPQIFEYTYQGKKHFHIPDVYISSLNLIVQVKSAENKHYRARDIEKEKAIDKVVSNSQFNYIKVYDKQYDDFFNYILNFNED